MSSDLEQRLRTGEIDMAVHRTEMESAWSRQGEINTEHLESVRGLDTRTSKIEGHILRFLGAGAALGTVTGVVLAILSLLK